MTKARNKKRPAKKPVIIRLKDDDKNLLSNENRRKIHQAYDAQRPENYIYGDYLRGYDYIMEDHGGRKALKFIEQHEGFEYQIEKDHVHTSASDFESAQAVLYMLRDISPESDISINVNSEEEKRVWIAAFGLVYQRFNMFDQKLFIAVGDNEPEEVPRQVFSVERDADIESRTVPANPTGIRNDCMFYSAAHFLAQAIRHSELDHIGIDPECAETLQKLVDEFAGMHPGFAAVKNESQQQQFQELKRWLQYYTSPNDTEVLLAPVLRRLSGVPLGDYSLARHLGGAVFNGLKIKCKYKEAQPSIEQDAFKKNKYLEFRNRRSPEEYKGPVFYAHNIHVHWVAQLPPRDAAYAAQVNLDIGQRGGEGALQDKIPFKPASASDASENGQAYNAFYNKYSDRPEVSPPPASFKVKHETSRQSDLSRADRAVLEELNTSYTAALLTRTIESLNDGGNKSEANEYMRSLQEISARKAMATKVVGEALSVGPLRRNQASLHNQAAAYDEDSQVHQQSNEFDPLRLEQPASVQLASGNDFVVSARRVENIRQAIVGNKKLRFWEQVASGQKSTVVFERKLSNEHPVSGRIEISPSGIRLGEGFEADRKSAIFALLAFKQMYPNESPVVNVNSESEKELWIIAFAVSYTYAGSASDKQLILASPEGQYAVPKSAYMQSYESIAESRVQANPSGMRNDCMFYTMSHLIGQAMRHGELGYLATDPECKEGLALLCRTLAEFHPNFVATGDQQSQFEELQRWLLHYSSANDTEAILAPVLRQISGASHNAMVNRSAVLPLLTSLKIKLKYSHKGGGATPQFQSDPSSEYKFKENENTPVFYVENIGIHWTAWLPMRDEAYARDASYLNRDKSKDKLPFSVSGSISAGGSQDYDDYYNKKPGRPVADRPPKPEQANVYSDDSLLSDADKNIIRYKNTNSNIRMYRRAIRELKALGSLSSDQKVQLREYEFNLRREYRIQRLCKKKNALYKGRLSEVQQRRLQEGDEENKAWRKDLSAKEKSIVHAEELQADAMFKMSKRERAATPVVKRPASHGNAKQPKKASAKPQSTLSSVRAESVRPEERKANKTERGGNLSNANLGKIRNVLDPGGGGDWNVPEHQKGEVKVTVTHKSKPGEKFDIHIDKFKTRSAGVDTFAAMLKAFQVSNPARNPEVTITNPSLEQAWRAAFNQVYGKDSKYTLKVNQKAPEVAAKAVQHQAVAPPKAPPPPPPPVRRRK